MEARLVKITEDLFVPSDFSKFHHYYADPEGEKEYSGITSVLGVLAKPQLIPWAARMACDYIREHVEYAIPGQDGGYWAIKPSTVEEARTAHTKKKEAAGTHGTDAHKDVEDYVNWVMAEKDGKPYVDVDLPNIKPFMEWAVANVDHFLFSERRMSNKALFIAGTADFAYVGKDGKRYMADFKTSSGIYGIDYWLQVAAYRLLAEGEGDAPYDGATIVRLGKKGPSDFEVQYLYDYETYKNAFLACLTLYRAQAAIAGMIVKGE